MYCIKIRRSQLMSHRSQQRCLGHTVSGPCWRCPLHVWPVGRKRRKRRKRKSMSRPRRISMTNCFFLFDTFWYFCLHVSTLLVWLPRWLRWSRRAHWRIGGTRCFFDSHAKKAWSFATSHRGTVLVGVLEDKKPHSKSSQDVVATSLCSLWCFFISRGVNTSPTNSFGAGLFSCSPSKRGAASVLIPEALSMPNHRWLGGVGLNQSPQGLKRLIASQPYLALIQESRIIQTSLANEPWKDQIHARPQVPLPLPCALCKAAPLKGQSRSWSCKTRKLPL